MPRGIFVKLVAVFLLIGLVPFLVIGVSTYTMARSRMTETVIEYWLVRIARETAAQLDREVAEMRSLVRSWADDRFLATDLLGGDRPTAPVDPARSERFCRFLDNRRRYRDDLDLLMILAPGGTVLGESSSGATSPDGKERRLLGRRIDEILPALAERSFIDAALSPTPTALSAPLVPLSTRDWHISPLVRLARGEPPFDLEKEGYPKSVKAYALGFASTILAADTRQPAGVLVAVFNWSRIQNVLDLVERRYQDADDPRKGEPRYPSGYPFLFASDLDTIIGHAHKQNLGTSLSGTHGLAAFRERMRGSPYGSYSYEYPQGTKKISGFAETATPSREGFGWMVGVGINSDEIFADVTSLRDALLVWALIVTGLVILAAALFSHRITEPLTRLMGYTGELARGNLDARVDIRTNDEIAVLADSFNRMAEDLKESSARLIKAEKELAWKEMARQVAHEIKNPLTPIVLSAQQLARAHKDRHRDFDEILATSVATIIDQCDALRRIAANFAAYATFPKRNVQPEEISALVRAAVEAYRPRLEGSTEVLLDDTLPGGLRVLADKDEMRRVFLNLFNNAIEAMEGRPGRLTVRLGLVSESELRIDVGDTGRGIPDDVRGRLFQPYFSTRTGGTGLGLAICRNIILEHHGKIDFTSRAGAGTTFTIVLPVHREAPPAPPAA